MSCCLVTCPHVNSHLILSLWSPLESSSGGFEGSALSPTQLQLSQGPRTQLSFPHSSKSWNQFASCLSKKNTVLLRFSTLSPVPPTTRIPVRPFESLMTAQPCSALITTKILANNYLAKCSLFETKWVSPCLLQGRHCSPPTAGAFHLETSVWFWLEQLSLQLSFPCCMKKKSNQIRYSPFSFPPGQQTGVHACQEQSDCPLQITTLFLCPKVEETSSRDLQCAWTRTFSIVMLAVSYFMLCFYRWSRLMPLCVLNRIWSMCCFIRCIHQAV